MKLWSVPYSLSVKLWSVPYSLSGLTKCHSGLSPIFLFVVVPLDTTIALLAADLHREHKLATADAIVYATARRMGAGLLTCDAHFEGLPNVVLFPKSA